MSARRDVAIVGGYFARCPLGGYAWQVLHYLLGLQRIGYFPVFYESTEYLGECFDPLRREMTSTCAPAIETVRRFFAAHGLGEHWSVYDASSGTWFGLHASALEEACQEARLAISLAAVQPLPPTPRAVRVFIDLDPGYTQIRFVQGDSALCTFLSDYHRHFTIGERIGKPGCHAPTGGIEWLGTRQPVALELWSAPAPPSAAPFTTIGRWHETRRTVEFEGQRYGWSKREEWAQFISLPERSGARFVLAMDADKEPSDLVWLRRHGWEVTDPLHISADPSTYREFIFQSAGEFTTAKDLNIRLRTGWFSDRSACYLAAGRAVVTQPTGFEDSLPVGRGLFAVRTLDEAADAVRQVRTHPGLHSAAARRIAAAYFDARMVLAELLQRL